MAINAMNRTKLDKDLKGGFANQEAIGILPSVLPNPLYLNLGCGNDIREGLLNIDLYSNDPRVIKMDIRQLDLPDNSVDLILASDVLEHISHREVDSVLLEWNRVLKENGELIIRCPSLKLQMKAYMDGIWDADVASYMIFGGQTNPGDYHCIGFDEHSIRKHLLKAGFVINSYEEHDIPQDNGFINLNMTIKSSKVKLSNTSTINKLPNLPIDQTETTKTSPFAGFDFSIKKDNEINQESIDLLAELVSDKPLYEEVQNIDTKAKLNIVWEGSQFVYHSLALINREHCKNIISSGQSNLTIIPYEPDEFDYKDYPEFEELHNNDIRFKADIDEETSKKPYLWIRHQWPPQAQAPQGAKWIVMQPWEFTSLRKDFVDIFNQADEIWTPSNYSRNAFLNSGVEFNKVQIIPNGINPQIFTPIGQKYSIDSNKKMKFLFVGGTIYRKGIDILLQAWIQSFKASDNVCLVIKDMGGNSFYKGQTFKDKILELQNNQEIAEIVYIDNMLTESQMAELYRACDVFVSPYRGEGFSLPTLEAMACGLPVIVTEGGATDDFVDDSFAFLIKSELKSIGTKLDDKEFANEAFLLEPSIESLSEYLENCYSNPSVLFSMGLIASLKARTLWTWKRATLKMYSRINTLYGTDLAKESIKILHDKNDAMIHFAIAENAYFDSNYQLAKDEFLQALNNKDLSIKHLLHIYHRLALLYINEGDNLNCDQYLNLCDRIQRHHPDTKYLRIIYHASKKNNLEAIEIASALLEQWEDEKFASTFGVTLDDLFVLTGDLFYAANDLEIAVKMYTSALKVNNANSYACYGSAICFKDSGAIDEAKTMLEWTLKLNPELDDARILIEELR